MNPEDMSDEELQDAANDAVREYERRREELLGDQDG